MEGTKKQKLIKTLIIIGVILIIALIIYLPLKLTGALDKISNAEDLKNIILSFGIYSYAVFFLVQILQTTILPIPAVVTTVAGVLIFGGWKTFILSLIAVMLGSIISFWLGKKLGKRLVVWVAGEKDAKKWEELLSKGKFTFFLMMLFPFFPDDILCIVAGITTMSYKYFIIVNLITRPIVIAGICFLGSGTLIPFSGWGIAVWVALAIIAIGLIIVSLKYQDKIEKFILRLTKSKEKAEETEAETNEEK